MLRAENRPDPRERGVALIVTLLAVGLLSALGLGLALSSSTARLADYNHEDAVTLFNAAESALELAARDLAQVPDWSTVLDGSVVSTVVDGVPSGTRTVPGGGILDLTRLTNELTCGLSAFCSDAQRQASSTERPWGIENPRWRLFLYSPLPSLATLRNRVPPYVAVWLGDDGREADGDPEMDGGAATRDGRYVIRARAEAFGSGTARRAVEAEIARVCRPLASGDQCRPGVRLQGWRIVSAVP